MKITQGVSAEEKKILTKMALLKLHLIESNVNMVMQQAHGLPFLMNAYTHYLYPKAEDKEKRIALNKRHSVFYLTNNIGGIFLTCLHHGKDAVQLAARRFQQARHGLLIGPHGASLHSRDGIPGLFHRVLDVYKRQAHARAQRPQKKEQRGEKQPVARI